ncbi:hypothetical protein V8E51_019151 [Hyaloscypha variabilis]
MKQGMSSSGAEPRVLSSTDDPWTVTFWSGPDDGVDVTTSKWNRIRALADYRAEGNWVRRDVIERAKMSHRIVQVVDHQYQYEDFGGRRHNPTEAITLIWFLNETTRTRSTQFFITPAGPSDMIFGKDFLDKEDCETNVKTVLPLIRVARHRSKEEEIEIQTTREGNSERDQNLEEAERQREREERERYRQSQHASSSETPAESRPASFVAAAAHGDPTPAIPSTMPIDSLSPSSSTSPGASSRSLPLLTSPSGSPGTSTRPSIE